MDLAPDEASQRFRAEFRAFLESAPAFATDFEGQRAWQRALFAQRWVAPHWPVEYGGRGAGMAEYAVYIEELARARVPQLANRVGLQTVGPVILDHGTPAQRARYLEKIAGADEIWCQLYSEPGAGSDLAGLTTSARLDGDTWRVTGRKIWTSYGAEADFGLLLARTEPDAPRSQGISCFVCDLRAPGVETRPLRTITGAREFAEVFLDDVPLPPDALIGARGDGWRIGNTGLASERGIAFPLKEQAALQVMLDDLLDRVAADQVVATPGQRDRLGHDLANLHLLRVMNLRTIGRLDAGEDLGAWPSLIKLTWEQASQHLGDTLFETAGSQDVHSEQDLAWAMLHYRMASIAGGTTQIQRTIIGERLLGLPREPRGI